MLRGSLPPPPPPRPRCVAFAQFPDLPPPHNHNMLMAITLGVIAICMHDNTKDHIDNTKINKLPYHVNLELQSLKNSIYTTEGYTE